MHCVQFWFTDKWAASWQYQENGLCAQRRLISAWASAQSDQSLCCLHEETLGPQLPIECTVKTLIRLGGYPDWSESSLGAKAILLVLSWGGSNAVSFVSSSESTSLLKQWSNTMTWNCYFKSFNWSWFLNSWFRNFFLCGFFTEKLVRGLDHHRYHDSKIKMSCT